MDSCWQRASTADTLHIPMRSDGSNPSPAAAALTLAQAVRARRRQLRLDQLVLCDLAGVGPAFLYSLERGKPTVRLDKVLAVLAVLGLELCVRPGREVVSVDDRLNDDGAP
jgi:y4mF family transcriptional regulator